MLRGSKISPAYTGLPSPSLQGAPPQFTCAPKSLEKSPARSFAFGTVVNVPELGTGRTERNPSYEKKKNVLLWPLYRWGMTTAPPNVTPKLFCRLGGRELV